MTRQIAQSLQVRTDIDVAWITELAQAFANRYFDALGDAQPTLSPAWRHAFDAMRDRRTSVLEDLIFAMTVHITHDLPLALGDISPGGAPSYAHIYDFHAVNDMMASSIELIVNATARRYAPYVRWLDRLGRPFDTMLTDYGVRMSRGLAWYNTLRIADPRACEQARAAIESSPTMIIDDIARPPIRPLRVLLRVLRWMVSFLRTWPSESIPRGMDVRREP
jgi:Family of unknown function (DUF5995)